MSMSPTPEMIEAARKAYVTELPETALYPSEFAMRAALTAALALLPGEPVAWQWRQTYAGRWGNWNDCGLSATDVQKWLDLAQELPDEVQVRPLYAAPAPLPVAVKEILDQVAEMLRVYEGEAPHVLNDELANLMTLAKGCRSALSSPVGGTEAHTDDLAVDRFAAAMKAKLAEKRAEGYGGWDNPEECTIEHLTRLLINHLGKGDPVDIGNFAMMIHQRGGTISPTPASDISALREEIARIAGDFVPDRDADAPLALQEIRDALMELAHHAAKGER